MVLLREVLLTFLLERHESKGQGQYQSATLILTHRNPTNWLIENVKAWSTVNNIIRSTCSNLAVKTKENN